MGAARAKAPQAVLFLCGQNAVRSPMAAALMKRLAGQGVYVGSAGVRQGEVDPFVAAALDEIGIDLGRHRPRSLEDLEEQEGLNFDLVVTLAPEAHHAALDMTRRLPFEVEYWPTPDPTTATGNREQRLEAYREVRDMLLQRIRRRFTAQRPVNE